MGEGTGVTEEDGSFDGAFRGCQANEKGRRTYQRLLGGCKFRALLLFWIRGCFFFAIYLAVRTLCLVSVWCLPLDFADWKECCFSPRFIQNQKEIALRGKYMRMGRMAVMEKRIVVSSAFNGDVNALVCVCK